MHSSHLRLTLTLLIALIGHVVVLYPTPEIISIPLKDPSYSVEVELTTSQANVNSQEAAETKEEQQIESSASEESKAIEEHLEESLNKEVQVQSGSKHLR